MARATTSTVDAPTTTRGERFTFAIDSTVAPSPPVAPEDVRAPARPKRRLFTDPVWVVCAAVLVALDAAVLYVASTSVWITIMVLVTGACGRRPGVAQSGDGNGSARPGRGLRGSR
ncbi:MAG: hypothetical protein MUP67_01210 [Acidimicrobiia bacterium]|nr:hypothetical protein [Acidimicrobiia bacterium]